MKKKKDQAAWSKKKGGGGGLCDSGEEKMCRSFLLTLVVAPKLLHTQTHTTQTRICILQML